MISLMIAIFVLGYACIALEHKLKIDKAASALVMFGLIWSVYALMGPEGETGAQLMEHLGSTCETLIFLIGAMTIVDLIDMHGGFYVITKHITTRNILYVCSIGQYDHYNCNDYDAPQDYSQTC